MTHYMSRDISMNVVALMYLINETLILINAGHAHYMSNMCAHSRFMNVRERETFMRHECREAHIMGNARGDYDN